MATRVELIRSGRGTSQVRPDRRVGYARVRPRIYAEREAWLSLEWWHRYEARVRAFRMLWPDAILSHESAALMHGLPLFSEPRSIHVFAPQRTKTVSRGDVRLHSLKDPRQVVLVDAGPVVGLEDTLIDVARHMNEAHALALWDAGIRQGAVMELLKTLRRTQSARRGSRTLEWVELRADPASESPGESVSRALVEWLGFEPPSLQQQLSTADGDYRGDLCWMDQRVIGEFDGFAKYDLGAGAAGDELRREKRREDALRRAGFTVARWEYRDLFRPERIRAALFSAGLTPRHAPDHASLGAYLASVRRETPLGL